MPEERELHKDCIIFKGSVYTSGYGSLRIDGNKIIAHRVAFKLHNPKVNIRGKCVCHHCDNPSCINPKHLFVGTIGDNNRDRARKGRSAKEENHGRAKLSVVDVRNIKRWLSEGQKQIDLAHKFNVDKGVIHQIKWGKIWKNV